MTTNLSRLKGCWLGKSIGGTLGIPAEGKMEKMNFSFYDPVPTVAPPNDDLELQLVWLDLIENAGSSLDREDFARGWRQHIHYMWDEYGRCRWNLRRGVPLDNLGTFENPFHAAMGSPIRSEIWACVFPGDPDSAAHYAALDASLDHGTEGAAGEVLFAAMQSRVAAGDTSVEEAIRAGLSYLPADYETSRAVALVLAEHARGEGPWPCWERLLSAHGNENFTHAPLNVALTIWALLYGAGDFEKSILLAVNGGYDTDCTAATAGATLGLLLGAEGIPERWSAPIGDGVSVGPGILGIRAPATLKELAARTAAVVGKLERRAWDGSVWRDAPPAPELDGLPGTVQITPAGGGQPVPWANGELPATVKEAGGAQWDWHVRDDEPKVLICLARGGAKVFVDDALALECPAGVPHVPATHRSGEGTQAWVNPCVGPHRVRVVLNGNDPRHEAAVMLAYPNLHLCPWTEQELPEAADLPPALPSQLPPAAS